MKAAGAVMIVLFKDLARKVKYPLGLQIVTDEEIGGFNGTKYQIEKGVSADFVIAGENTNMQISNKAKGILQVKLKTWGKTSHGAYPWLGDNALLKLNSEINKLLAIYPIPTKESWRTTINVGRIETTNKTWNKVPDYAEAHLDIRFVPEDKGIIVDKIKKGVSKDTEVEILMHETHQYTPEEDKYVAELRRQFKDVTKKDAIMYATHGGSDVRFYEGRGIPSVCFGPKGGGHHSDAEWVDIESLDAYYTILKKFLLEIV